MPRRLTRKCSRGLRPRLIQTKLLSASSFSLTSSYLSSGSAETIFCAASCGVEQQVRIDEGRHHRHRGREHHAVAVDDVGALRLDRAAARRHALGRLGAVAQQRDVAHAQRHRGEHHHEQGRGDHKALACELLHVALQPLLFRPVTRAGRRGVTRRPVRAGQICATTSPTLPFLAREDFVDRGCGDLAVANRTRCCRLLY